MPFDIPDKARSKLVIPQQYDATASFKNLFHVQGTAVELVMKKPLFWFLVSVHYTLFFLKKFHKCTESTATSNCIPADEIFERYPLHISDIAMLSGLVTFCVVFYNGNCFSKYQRMYDAVVGIMGRLHNIGLYLRAYYTSPTTRWNVLRYLLASHYIFYWSLRRRYYDWKSSQYKNEPGSFDDLVKNTLIAKGVLIGVEAKQISAYAGNKHKLLYAWSIVAMKRIMQTPQPAGEKGNPYLNTEFEQTAILTNLKDEIVGMRAAIGAIDNTMLFPIPFQYYHIVNLTLIILLLFLAYAFLFVNNNLGNMFTLIAYPMITFVLLGLVEVANYMADPFGSNPQVDFNQDGICDAMYEECKKLCEEPEEDFLANLGDISFNPSRNEDGSLKENIGQDGEEEPEIVIPQEPMWAQRDVQLIMDERDKLKNELAMLGVQELAKEVRVLIDCQRQAAQRMTEVDDAGKETVRTMAEVSETIASGVSAIVGGLNLGDSYNQRYVDSRDAIPIPTAQPAMLEAGSELVGDTLGLRRQGGGRGQNEGDVGQLPPLEMSTRRQPPTQSEVP